MTNESLKPVTDTSPRSPAAWRALFAQDAVGARQLWRQEVGLASAANTPASVLSASEAAAIYLDSLHRILAERHGPESAQARRAAALAELAMQGELSQPLPEVAHLVFETLPGTPMPIELPQPIGDGAI